MSPRPGRTDPHAAALADVNHMLAALRSQPDDPPLYREVLRDVGVRPDRYPLPWEDSVTELVPVLPPAPPAPPPPPVDVPAVPVVPVVPGSS